jgi:endo-alpha-1,4-polygalactosaminidase (GH114 family)
MIKDLENIQDYVLYYGREQIERLSEYDLAIVEPLGQNEKSVEYLHKKGTSVIAYISFLEISAQSYGNKLLKPEDYLIDNGAVVENLEYGNKLLDLASDRWQGILLHHIGDLYMNHNYDGIFIDTLADIEYFQLSCEIKNSLINSLIKLLQKIKERFPRLLILQNNGIEFLYSYTSDYIDGICIENIYLSHDNMEVLDYLKYSKALKIFILTNSQIDAEAMEYTKKMTNIKGYLYYHASNGYEK